MRWKKYVVLVSRQDPFVLILKGLLVACTIREGQGVLSTKPESLIVPTVFTSLQDHQNSLRVGRCGLEMLEG